MPITTTATSCRCGHLTASNPMTKLITVNVTDGPSAVPPHWMASVGLNAHPAGWALTGVGDLTGDGTSDMVWYNATTGNVDLWKISNGQWAGSVDIGPHPLGWQPAGIGDLNGDGTERLALAQSDDRQRRSLENRKWPMGRERRHRTASAWLPGRRDRRFQSRRNERRPLVQPHEWRHRDLEDRERSVERHVRPRLASARMGAGRRRRLQSRRHQRHRLVQLRQPATSISGRS